MQEEAGNEIKRLAAFQLKQVVENLPDDLGFFITQASLEAQYQDDLIAFHIPQGAECVGADGDGRIGERVHEVAQHERALDIDAGRERQSAGAAQGGGGVLFPAPDRLQLDVTQTAEKGGGLSVLQGDQRLGNSVFGPTLRIAGGGLLEEEVERGQGGGEA